MDVVVMCRGLGVGAKSALCLVYGQLPVFIHVRTVSQVGTIATNKRRSFRNGNGCWKAEPRNRSGAGGRSHLDILGLKYNQHTLSSLAAKQE